MEVQCDKCQARYRVDDARIGPQGLAMRCGKCQNTFRVMRPSVAPAAAPAKAVEERPPAQSTMIFAAPATTRTAPPKPAANDDVAARTMVFPAAPGLKKAAEPPASGTVVFSHPPARPKPAPDAQRTLVFGAGTQGAPAAPQPEPPAAESAPPAAAASTILFGESPQPAPQAAAPAEPAKREIEASEPLDEEPPRKPGPFEKAPPRGLLIGVAFGLALLIVAGGALVAWRKLARRPPPQAAVEMLAAAEAEARQDTLASLASAEAKARDAIEAAGPRARFPEAAALLGRIEIQWADALDDVAARLSETSADDPRVAQLQAQARAKAKSAFEVLSPAAKADRDSADLQLALADYYRAQRSPSNLSRHLKALRDDPRAKLIAAMATAQQIDGAERALPQLKAAAETDPKSARVHFRLALAYAALRDQANERAELAETLRLSPGHERAQDLLQQLGTAGEPAPK